MENTTPSISNSAADAEKVQPRPDLEEIGEREGYVLDTAIAKDEGLQTTKDGRTVLIPQPSSSPNDPLNWSPFKKHLILLIVSATAFLPDYGSATGAVTLVPQAAEWNMLANDVNHSQAGNVFMLGVAGPFIVAGAAYFGRYPMLFWFSLLAVGTSIWCAAAESFSSFMAARILNGFFSTVAQAGGLMFVKDVFFFHELPRKINIYSGFIILSPYLGPMFSAFIVNTQIWQWAFGLYAILTGLCFIAIVLFMEETYYDRKTVQPELVPNGPRWKRMIGIQQRQTGYLINTPKDAIMRPITLLLKPVVPLTALYYMLTFCWVIGINTTLSIFVGPVYGFGPKQIGFYYFTPVVAALLGEVAGHWLHDIIARVSARRNNGRLEPEARLNAIWVAKPFMFAGTILLGFSLQNQYHYMVTAVAWGMYVFGIMIVTVAVNAYVLDSYPEASGEVAAWINFGRVTGGFIVSYFMVEWATNQGAKRMFGTMTGIVGFACLIIIVLQVFGKRMRSWAGPANFKTA